VHLRPFNYFRTDGGRKLAQAAMSALPSQEKDLGNGMNPGQPYTKTPDEWLAAAEGQKRGRFKVFLGYAPGVGKTFSMLSEAVRRRSRGEDIVIGVVETHGRPRTAELARATGGGAAQADRVQGHAVRRDGCGCDPEAATPKWC